MKETNLSKRTFWHRQFVILVGLLIVLHGVSFGETCHYAIAGDLNNDCIVDFFDVAFLAENWLIDCDIDPNNPACIALDLDNDGYDVSVDCNDDDPNINPGVEDICDGLDNNCDGQIDEDCVCTIDWGKLQWPVTIYSAPGTDITVYGRVYKAGITDMTSGNDPVETLVGQVGFGPRDSDPSVNPDLWTWFDAVPNPFWDGEPPGWALIDEYMATLTTPAVVGSYDFCFRFSCDSGMTWLYCDEDGSDNGYQTEYAGKMEILE